MLVFVMLLHFIADFLLQSREMANKKSTELKWLFKHLGIQFGVFFVGMTWAVLNFFIMVTSNNPFVPQYSLKTMFFAACIHGFAFSFVNALIHGMVHWNIWKLYKLSAWWRIRKIVIRKHGTWTQPPEEDVNIKAETANWRYWEDYWFWVTVGLDQTLHIITLFVLVVYLM
jgi:Protein of unknown function (DUF3307)